MHVLSCFIILVQQNKYTHLQNGYQESTNWYPYMVKVETCNPLSLLVQLHPPSPENPAWIACVKVKRSASIRGKSLWGLSFAVENEGVNLQLAGSNLQLCFIIFDFWWWSCFIIIDDFWCWCPTFSSGKGTESRHVIFGDFSLVVGMASHPLMVRILSPVTRAKHLVPHLCPNCWQKKNTYIRFDFLILTSMGFPGPTAAISPASEKKTSKIW